MKSDELKICLVDDNDIFREGVKYLLNSYTNWKIVQEYSSGEAFYNEVIKKEFPDIVLMDYKMRGVDGITITRKYLARFPEVKVIAVTMHTYKLFSEELIMAGFKGCIEKGRLYDHIKPAVESVMNGGLYFMGEF